MSRPSVLVMVSGYSRAITAVMLPTRRSEDLLAPLPGGWAATDGMIKLANQSEEEIF
jgi:hypothetical protein